ncbi:MAG: aminomethyl-transferring glycine dehydrogenase subunit GcvPB, partial [Rhodospirillaceae bacterium]|nr:aminomethyl-transferring glycine dehydrogenase subunit GcvPB [Rhodospirillaceae bacterium]
MTTPNPLTNTISGNRGLQLEEPLIFEMDVPGRSGVDLPDVPKHKERLGGMKRKGQVGLPGLAESQVV